MDTNKATGANETLYVDWPADRLRLYGQKYLDAIRGKLAADYAPNDSDEALERILGPCVCGNSCAPMAWI